MQLRQGCRPASQALTEESRTAGFRGEVGGAGAGKTTFGMQVLAKGAAEHHESGILVAFAESAGRVIANTSGFAWGEVLKDTGTRL